MELPCFTWKTQLHRRCLSFALVWGSLMDPCVVQVSETQWESGQRLPVGTVHSQMGTCWTVRADSHSCVPEGFLSLLVDPLEFSKVSNSQVDCLTEAGWITSCLYKSTNPTNRPLPFKLSRVLENVESMCTGSRLNGKRGCCCWPDTWGAVLTMGSCSQTV